MTKVLDLDIETQWNLLLDKYSSQTEYISKKLIDECFNILSDVNQKPHISVKFVMYKGGKCYYFASYKKWTIHIPYDLIEFKPGIPEWFQKSAIHKALLHMLSLPWQLVK